MWTRRERGGVLLDLVLAFAFVVLAAFVLAHLGVTLPEVVHGAEQFFGR